MEPTTEIFPLFLFRHLPWHYYTIIIFNDIYLDFFKKYIYI